MNSMVCIYTTNNGTMARECAQRLLFETCFNSKNSSVKLCLSLIEIFTIFLWVFYKGLMLKYQLSDVAYQKAISLFVDCLPV